MENNTGNWKVPGPESPEKKKKGFLREWLDALIFAMVVATLVRWFFFEPFTIPTPSMEKSLLVGDFLFVSKLHYGARTPKTILQVPLTHQKIWGTNIPSYLDWIQLPQFRLPGFSEVKKGDCVVFNWPADSLYPSDLKTNYIKRCVATPGDVLEVRNRQVFINGLPAENPEKLMFSYNITSASELGPRVLKSMEVANYDDGFRPGEVPYEFPVQFYQDTAGLFHYNLHMTPGMADSLRRQPYIRAVEIRKPEDFQHTHVYGFDAAHPWNEDNYGPVRIPGKDTRVELTPANIPVYFPVIRDYEGHENVTLSEGRVLIGGKPVTEYTFRQNYYWMMGDNRHNSLDSRYWGFVPDDYVVGKAWLIWFSVSPDNRAFFDGIRWKRLFNLVD